MFCVSKPSKCSSCVHLQPSCTNMYCTYVYHLALWLYIFGIVGCNLLEFYVVIMGIKMDSFDFMKLPSFCQKRFWPNVAINSCEHYNTIYLRYLISFSYKIFVWFCFYLQQLWCNFEAASFIYFIVCTTPKLSNMFNLNFEISFRKSEWRKARIEIIYSN